MVGLFADDCRPQFAPLCVGYAAQVLRGVLSREHTVSVGQYNHEKAAPMIRTGFDVLLRRLPQATSKRVSKA